MLEPIESHSMIPILTSQRDRFKQRFEDCEARVKQLESTIMQQQYENQNLKQDNLKLYESKRYVEQYQENKKRYSNEVESRYKAAYEQENDPFKLFKIEQERRYLNPAERLLKQVLSNRISRIVFLIYALGLHLLVFFTMYELIELK
jgi:homeobox protein cut-like